MLSSQSGSSIRQTKFQATTPSVASRARTLRLSQPTAARAPPAATSSNSSSSIGAAGAHSSSSDRADEDRSEETAAASGYVDLNSSLVWDLGYRYIFGLAC